jgi:hypothetical protein
MSKIEARLTDLLAENDTLFIEESLF